MSTPAALMVVPEFILHQTLTSLLTFLRVDYAANSADTTKSYLHKLLVNAGFQRYDFFTQAIEVFTLPEDDPRYLTCELMYNAERKGSPSIYVSMPSEQTAANGNGLGTDENYEENLFTEEDDTDPDNPILATATPVYTRRYQAVYNIMVTSDNPNEIVLLFHTVKALLTAVTSHLHENGLQQVGLGGQDIQPYDELSSKLFMRAVTVTLQYDTSVPSIYPLTIPSGVLTGGIPINPSPDLG